MRRRIIPVAVVAVAVGPGGGAGAGGAGAAPAGAGGPQRKSVKVADNYYLPAKLTVNKGSVITWKWPVDVAIDVHDVKLKSGPPGVRRWHSEPASSGYRYKRTLKKAGTYRIVCTLHEEMKMTIRVRR
jgi:plastocyanin